MWKKSNWHSYWHYCEIYKSATQHFNGIIFELRFDLFENFLYLTNSALSPLVGTHTSDKNFIYSCYMDWLKVHAQLFIAYDHYLGSQGPLIRQNGVKLRFLPLFRLFCGLEATKPGNMVHKEVKVAHALVMGILRRKSTTLDFCGQKPHWAIAPRNIK